MWTRQAAIWLVIAVTVGLSGCTGDQGDGPATAAATARAEIGLNATVDTVAYISIDRVEEDRLPRARLEPAGELRIDAQARRYPAFRLAESPRSAMRYTERTGGGYLLWQPMAVLYARRDLAQRQSQPVTTIQTMEVLHEEWSDGCLGVAQPGQMCTQAIVPGFRVTLRLAGKSYEYHTDQKERIALVP